ncbi:MAG: NAD-glutamate dehydrogenase, partial [Gammaproteobacteria bacterium]|nr:NAD-glutamate dehydrogenase [Gammaproteobacteria bacterium]
MERRLSDSRSRVVSKIVAQAEKSGFSGQEIDIADYIDRYYRNVAIDDLRISSPADLAGAALSHLNLAINRPPGQTQVRIYNPTRKTNGWASTHTIVEIVNDNMPFLVDSAGMAINRLGYSIHLTVHPTFSVTRDKKGDLREIGKKALLKKGDDNESFLRIEIDRSAKGEEFAVLEKALLLNLGDVRKAVADWSEMREMALAIADKLHSSSLPLSERVIDEGREMLRWMVDDHFTFLGYREYSLSKSEDTDELSVIPGSGLGILRGEPRDGSVVVLHKDIRRQARSKDLLLITKANSLANVHRNSYLDYIGIKVFAAGKVVGEKRFLGLFTSTAYSLSPSEIPMLRYKVEQIMQNSGMRETGHGAKALQHILHTFPRDELFQSSVADLIRTTVGIFHLQERQRINLFVRRDAFRRFFSCMVFVPHDRYTTQIRLRIEEILLRAFDGKSLESTVHLSESNLARLHTIVRIKPGSKPKISIIGIENEIIDAVRSWEDHLRDILVERFGEARGLQLRQMYGQQFPVAYKEDVTPREATFDVERLAALTDKSSSLRMSLYRPDSYEKNQLRFKLFHRQDPIPISDVLPMLENMGLRVISEQPYHVRLQDGKSIWIQDFQMVYESETLLPAEVNEIFQESFASTWLGNAENDGFNRLVLAGRLEWREVAVLRAYCRYLLQTGLPFSQKYMEQALDRHVLIARMLAELFRAKQKPGLGSQRRQKEIDRICVEIRDALDQVQSQDEDRILAAFLTVIKATLRSNFYQPDDLGEPKSYISLKFDPQKIPELPLPRPRFEIFVYSPRMEGIHLRGGMIARGGLRWSDRQEDFRTEILGLMKAQSVKNTLIVPMGAKGGFVCKRLPEGPREEIQREVVECYRTLIRGMLDVTDNLVEGKLVPPRRVVRHDDDDPYLVVAADKGTATFSDIANGISQSYGFWLDDAFASGGSAGYDHKKMGITARGAWESVKRHFREIGKNIQSEEFTVIGCGDMAGDVFGNGMLLSKHIRLIGAFNHLHIFVDPNPDAGKSWVERKRLFDMPRSAWSDYNAKLISKGGGIFERKSKSIKLTPEMKALFWLEKDKVPPNELIKAMLMTEAELMWFGGIGTYVKASDESHADVGDRANDSLRVNATELRCKVIGEGANLGLSQLGRIEFALSGGHLNTDSIDNSAGVDCS